MQELRAGEEEKRWEKSGRKRNAGKVSSRGSQRMHDYGGSAGFVSDTQGHEVGHSRDGANRRREMSEESIRRRTILGESSRRY